MENYNLFEIYMAACRDLSKQVNEWRKLYNQSHSEISHSQLEKYETLYTQAQNLLLKYIINTHQNSNEQ